ncbi:MAG: hypothetical protein HONBIEJF_01722 [Fimbriimonadaceae bacterium]|nr:hypothetical protein [Fimbriimonadaceae bacterium]
MTLALGLAVLSVQAKVPELLPGANATFYRTYDTVQGHLAAGRFAQAKKASNGLTGAELVIDWSDSEVPSNLRNLYRDARDRAAKAWKTAVPSLIVTYGKPGRLKLSFAKGLPPNPDSPGPAGAVTFSGSGDGLTEMVISTVRGNAKTPAEPRDIYNEVLFAIGYALGLERTPYNGSAMGRHELPYALDLLISDLEREQVEHHLKIGAALRSAAEKGQRIEVQRPALRLQPTRLQGPTDVVQGQIVPLTVELTNSGSGTLRVKLIPDCGCFILGQPAPIAAGETRVVQVQIQTRDFPGELAKTLFVYSNDVEQPIRQLPLTMTVQHRYRFLSESPGNTILVDDAGGKVDLYLHVNPKHPLVAKEVRVQGQKAAASLQPFKGTVAGEAIDGYKIGVLVGPNTIPGRSLLSLAVITNEPDFGDLRYAFYVQKGIVMLPDQIYLGRVGKKEASSYIVVQRPGKPFKILGVEVDHPSIAASFAPTDEVGQYRVSVRYNGKAVPGHIDAKLVIRTDDPKQPKLEASISAIAE